MTELTEGKIIGQCPSGHTVRITNIADDGYVEADCDECGYMIDIPSERIESGTVEL